MRTRRGAVPQPGRSVWGQQSTGRLLVLPDGPRRPHQRTQHQRQRASTAARHQRATASSDEARAGIPQRLRLARGPEFALLGR